MKLPETVTERHIAWVPAHLSGKQSPGQLWGKRVPPSLCECVRGSETAWRYRTGDVCAVIGSYPRDNGGPLIAWGDGGLRPLDYCVIWRPYCRVFVTIPQSTYLDCGSLLWDGDPMYRFIHACLGCTSGCGVENNYIERNASSRHMTSHLTSFWWHNLLINIEWCYTSCTYIVFCISTTESEKIG